jgi:phage terminase small subunit
MTDDQEYGPAMAALSEKQRAFVMAMIEVPGCSNAEAARRAGYSDVAEGAKVRGFYCAHNPAVQEAMREEAGKRLNSSSLAAAGVLLKLLTDEAIEPKDRIKAAGMLLDRSGFGAAQTINVNKTVTDRTGPAMLERIAELAARHGLDPAKLLGANVSAPIDAEFSEVKQGETE